MKKTLFLMLSCVLSLSLIACDEEKHVKADNEAQDYTEDIMQRANDTVGFPSINNFTEREWASMIFELRDRADLQTYTYLYVPMTGELRFMCHSVGYGLPYSVQFTNPEKVIDPDSIPDQSYWEGEGTPVVMPQPDPNGLFMPQGLSATWILAVDKGKLKPIYVEPEIIVSPVPLTNKTPAYP